MKNIFGYKTIVSLLLGLIWVNIFSNSWLMTARVAAVLVVIIILFVPVIVFAKDTLKVYSLNPFRKKMNVSYKDISKVNMHAGDIHCKLSVHLNDGRVLTSNSFFRYYDMEGLYQQFRNRNITITSTGVRAISWQR